MEGKPAVSVILPTYNRAHMLGRAVGSVLGQEYGDLELIIVDDASSDNTRGIIEAFDDGRIVYLRHERNRGAAVARNAGIAAARGDFIAFLDSDDEWKYDKLSRQMGLFGMLPEEYGVVYSGFDYVLHETGEVLDTVTARKRGSVHLDLLERCFLINSTSVARRRCFEICGMYDESLHSCQDWELWIRVSERFKFDYVDEVLASVYVHGQQISTDLAAKIVAREIILDRYRDELEQLPHVFSRHIKRQGLLYCLSGSGREGRKRFLESLKIDGSRVENYAHILLSLGWPGLHRRLIVRHSMTTRAGITFYF